MLRFGLSCCFLFTLFALQFFRGVFSPLHFEARAAPMKVFPSVPTYTGHKIQSLICDHEFGDLIRM
jgi:hypothetical protein